MFILVKRFVVVVLLFLALVLGFVFALENSEVVSVTILGVAMPIASIGLWVVCSVFFGGVIGWSLASLLAGLKRKR